MHLAVDAHGMQIRVIITEWAAADCAQAAHLIAGLTAEQLLADKGYDSDKIIEQAERQEVGVVIPQRKNRTNRREYDKDLYKFRHLVENAF